MLSLLTAPLALSMGPSELTVLLATVLVCLGVVRWWDRWVAQERSHRRSATVTPPSATVPSAPAPAESIAGRELERLRAAMSGIANGVVVADSKGNLIDWNPAALRLHGYASIDEVRHHVAHFVDTFVLAEPGGRVLSVPEWPIPRMIRGEHVDNVELLVRRTDTQQEWFINYTGAIVRSPLGEIELLVLTLQDTTEARRAAKALRESEERFRQLADAMPQIVWTAGGDGQIDYYNRRGLELIGEPNASSSRWDALFHPDDVAPTHAIWSESMRTGNAFEHEYRLQDARSGEFRWWLGRAVPVTDDERNIVRWIGTSTDIHELKLAGDAIRNGSTLLRTLIEGIIDPVYIKDVDGRYLLVNAALASAMNRTPEEIVGNDDITLLGPEVGGIVRNSDRRVLASEGTQTYEETVTTNGRTFHFLETKSPHRDAGGRVVGLIGISRDISAHKQSEERWHEQQAQLAHLERVRTVGQMASGLAHELNQPLGAIANYTEACRVLLERGNLSAPQLADALAAVVSETARAGEIIRRLRSFVKKQRPHGQPVDINATVRDSASIMSYDLRTAGVQPQWQLDCTLGPVLADHVQIEQVLINLMRNAIDAMRDNETPERRLIVRTACNGQGKVRVSISDNGSGVPADQLPRIFDAFYTTKSNGMGIGLALCRTIIEEHGGEIAAERNPDRGMTFSFTLRPTRPVTDVQQEAV
ncbi:MAG TPA: PAS domain-containing protein [Tepidisphaeraceae bacterium]|nr:PAS domain-containing protein [Tepidisphaeraceae bacterium]